MTSRSGSDRAEPAAGCFLSVCLTLLTAGGLLTIRELLRTLWAEDRLLLNRDVLTRFHRLGPILFTHHLARNEIRRVFLQRSGAGLSTLTAQLGAGIIELTDLGTTAERTEAACRLRAMLGLPQEGQPSGPAVLSEDWQEIITPHREDLLLPNLRTRRKQALVMSVIAVMVWTVAVLLAWESLIDLKLWVVTAMVGAAAAWLNRGCKEWRIQHGKLVQQRRFGENVTELAEARALNTEGALPKQGPVV